MEYDTIIKETLSNNLTNKLRKYISNMDFSLSKKLPSEIEIGKIFGVSRITVRKALDDLEKEGIVWRIHGKGTFVNPDMVQIKVNIVNQLELCHLIKACGYEDSQRLLDFGIVPASTIPQYWLKLDKKVPLYYIVKGFYADDRLAVVCVDMMEKSFFQEDLEASMFEKISTFDVVRNLTGHIFVKDKIEIRSLSKKQASHLLKEAKDFECDSLLEFVGAAYIETGTPALFGVTFYDTSIIRFNLIRNSKVY